jgi:hypothetical protein
MDEDGNAMFASTKNVAARARVTDEQAERAIKDFESPDPDSGDPENDGRRIERFPGGWHVLNAHKYRAIVTKAVQREKTRERVANWRANHKDVTPCNDLLRKGNLKVTPSEAETDSDNKDMSTSSTTVVFEHWKKTFNHPKAVLDSKRSKIIKAALKLYSIETLCKSLTGYMHSKWHMGDNDRKTVFDGIDLLLRDAEHIDKGLEFFNNPHKELEQQQWM